MVSAEVPPRSSRASERARARRRSGRGPRSRAGEQRLAHQQPGRDRDRRGERRVQRRDLDRQAQQHVRARRRTTCSSTSPSATSRQAPTRASRAAHHASSPRATATAYAFRRCSTCSPTGPASVGASESPLQSGKVAQARPAEWLETTPPSASCKATSAAAANTSRRPVRPRGQLARVGQSASRRSPAGQASAARGSCRAAGEPSRSTARGRAGPSARRGRPGRRGAHDDQVRARTVRAWRRRGSSAATATPIDIEPAISRWPHSRAIFASKCGTSLPRQRASPGTRAPRRARAPARR